MRPGPCGYPGVHKPPNAGAKIHEMRQKYIKGRLCGNCCEETGGERNEGWGGRGREADGLLHCERTESARQQWDRPPPPRPPLLQTTP